MTFKQFEDVPVWQDAADLSAALFAFTEDGSFRGKGDLANQLQRAGLSVPNNIAEGFERGTTGEVITFLHDARASAGEVRSILCVMERIPAFAHLKSQISNLKSRAASVSRQLRACAASLPDSDIRGQRPLTIAGRECFEQQQRAMEFMARLRRESAERLAGLAEKRRQDVGAETN